MQTSASNEKETSRGDGLRYEYAGALPVYRFERLNGDTALIHAVFTRRGGVSVPPYASLNLGHTVGDNPEAVEINHDRVYRALGVPRARVATCHLTHSADVLPVGSSDGGRVVGQGDAMVTADADVYLGMRFADCAPILLHDPLRRVVGLAHAGWRGTVKNVAGAVVKTMVNQLACSPQNIVAVIGPAIGPCCYQVGEDVIQAVEGALPWRAAPHHSARLFSRHNGRHAYFDLWEANRQQLEAAGVGRVVVSGVCTACRTDHFFSHRAERGRTGRFGVMIGYRG